MVSIIQQDTANVSLVKVNVKEKETGQSVDQSFLFVSAQFVDKRRHQLFACRRIGVDRAVHALPAEGTERRFSVCAECKRHCQML